jgi:hypothetical protein
VTNKSTDAQEAPILSFSRMLQEQEAKEKGKTTVAHQTTVAQDTTVAQTQPEPLHDATVAHQATVAHKTTVAQYAIVDSEYTSVPNDVWDEVMPTLNVYDQAVLWRLYRLTRGHRSDTCRVGLEKLGKACNIGKRQVSTSLDRLVKTGLVERVGADFGNPNKKDRGGIYKVNLPAAQIAKKSIKTANKASELTLAQGATVAQGATNKLKDLKRKDLKEAEPKKTRLSPEEIEAFTATVVDLLKEGQDMKLISARFAPVMHAADWAIIQSVAKASFITKGHRRETEKVKE